MRRALAFVSLILLVACQSEPKPKPRERFVPPTLGKPGTNAPKAPDPKAKTPPKAEEQPKAGVEVANSAEFFPRKQGLTWTWDVSYEQGGQEIARSVHRWVIDGEETHSERKYVRIKYSTEQLVPIPPKGKGVSKGVTLQRFGEKGIYGRKPGSPADSLDMPLPLKTGMKWSKTDGYNVVDFEVLGFGDTKVQGKVYKSCLKIKCRHKGPTPNSNFEATFYYARGVGEVQRVKLFPALKLIEIVELRPS